MIATLKSAGRTVADTLKSLAMLLVGIPIGLLYMLNGWGNILTGKFWSALGFDFGAKIQTNGRKQVTKGKAWMTP